LGLRRESLAAARERVVRLQMPYRQFIRWSADARGALREKIEALYRDCQQFATTEIAKLAAQVELDFGGRTASFPPE
jgi:hypothetical protein